jgi:predicted nucleotidyltransferase
MASAPPRMAVIPASSLPSATDPSVCLHPAIAPSCTDGRAAADSPGSQPGYQQRLDAAIPPRSGGAVFSCHDLGEERHAFAGTRRASRAAHVGGAARYAREDTGCRIQRGLGDVRVFGSVARDEAGETSDVDLLVASGPRTTLFDLSGFALDVEEIVGRHVDVATPRGLKARMQDRVLAEAVAL